MAYAENTNIELETSIAEIVAMVKRAGGERVGQFHDGDRYYIWFTLDARQIRFTVPLVTEYKGPARHSNGREVDKGKWLEQRNRQKGRALMLVIKAKLESVESGVETFEQAFLANIMMTDKRTVYEHVKEPLELVYAGGEVKPLLLGGPS